MPDHPHLDHAPVVEALLDIRVEPASGFSLEDLKKIADQLAPDYPKRGERRNAGIEVMLDTAIGASTAKATTTAEGFILRDESGKRLTQVMLGGFTQNLLKPYSDFDSLVQEAARNWKLYVEIAQPQRIVRTALRYINDLRVPARSQDAPIEQYMPFLPKIPDVLPQETLDFASRVTIYDEALGFKAIIAQLYPGEFGEDGVQVVLDIDAFSEEPLAVDDYGALWARFAKLRKLKNDIFFSYTTPKLLEKYK